MNIRETIRKIINEDNRMREPIRKIVKDIISIVKEEDEGEFYLPEYFEDTMVYEFIGLNPFSVELIIEYGKFGVNAQYMREDDTIVVKIQYEEGNKKNMLYKLIGELNEIIAHELRHSKQQQKSMFDLDVEEPEGSLEYYTQPHEIDAQYYGFKRLSKLLKKPFKDVVEDWFDTHKELHQLTDDEIEIVINKILKYR
jgi:hypothetical protein